MEEKEETRFHDQDWKICKVTEFKITEGSQENFSDRNQVPLQRPTVKYSKDLEKDSYHNCQDVNYQLTGGFFDTLNRDTFGESTLPLSKKDNFSKRRPVSLGKESSRIPNRDKAEEKSGYGKSEKLRRKPVDFATATIAEFGFTPESLTKQSVEETEQHDSEKQKKKKASFGIDLSPEIFDEGLSANTPLHEGATSPHHLGLQSNSPFTELSVTEDPLSQPNFDSSDESLFKECIKPLQELMEDKVAPESFLCAENKEETVSSFTRITRSCTKRKYGTIFEEIDSSISKATSAKNTNNAKNPRKNKFQRQKRTVSAAEKTTRVKHTSYGKRRRKKKAEEFLYGEREMASKKPLLSPIPEIPEAFSSASSPNTPRQMQDNHKKKAFLPDEFKSKNTYEDVQQKKVFERMKEENIDTIHTLPNSKDLDSVEATSSKGALFHTSGDQKSVSSTDHQFPNTVVPEAKCIFDTSDYIQQGQESACEEEENNSLTENKKLQGNFINRAEPLTPLQILEPQNTVVHTDAERMECSPKDYSRSKPPRKGRNGTVCISYIKNLNFETIGNNFSVSSNVGEILSAAQLKNDSLEESLSDASDGKRKVRRSMRLHKDAETEGLVWIQVPNETQVKPQLLTSYCKIRRRASISVLKESEDVCHRENFIEFSSLGKENNNNSVHFADGSCKRQRRRSMSVFTPQSQKRNMAGLENGNGRSNRKLYNGVEISLENQSHI